MIQKRLLLIEKADEPSGLFPVPGLKFYVTYEPSQALSLLMGGGTILQRNRYGEEKIRPHLLLMHDSFLKSDGGEFLELIRKYYSLRDIRVFIFGNTDQPMSQEIIQRYNIAGFFALPVSMEQLLAEAEKAAQDIQPFFRKIMLAPVVMVEDNIKSFFSRMAGQKSVFFAGGKLAVKSKIALTGISAALALAVSLPILYTEEKTTPETEQIVKISSSIIIPAEETAVEPQTEEPPPAEDVVQKQPVRKKTALAVEPEREAAVDSANSTILQEAVTHRIRVIEDTSAADAFPR